jgi:hypothetical protein
MSAFQLGIDLSEFLSGLIDRAVVARTRGQFDLYLELDLNWDYLSRTAETNLCHEPSHTKRTRSRRLVRGPGLGSAG